MILSTFIKIYELKRAGERKMRFNQLEKEAGIEQNGELSFFIELGRDFYKFSQVSKNLSLCLTLPRIDYISLLISLGIVDSLYSDTNKVDFLDNIIKKNTLILYKRPNVVKEEAYTFIGMDEDGYPIVKSKHRPPMTMTIKNDNWRKLVRIAPTQKKYKTNQSFKNNSFSSLSDHYPPEIISSLLNKPAIRILLVTVKSRISTEISEKIHNHFTFQDWLLPKCFSSAQAPFTIELVNYKIDKKDININEETIIIYDGANAYYQSSLRDLNNPEIIILGRNSNFEVLTSVAEEIYENEDLSLDYISDSKSAQIIPKGIEMIAWKRGEV